MSLESVQTRRRAAGGLLLASLAALASPALAEAGGGRGRDLQAEQFVQVQAQRVITTLADTRMAEGEKRRAFRQVIDEVADVPRITNFVLGKYARTITPAQRQAFAAAFRTYAEAVYQNRLGDYRGERLKVTGSVARKPGDVVVSTLVSGGRIAEPLPVAWRVVSAGADWKLIDVQFKGVWLAITQQQDFVSTIDNAGGDIGVLIARLERDARKPGAAR